MIDKEPSKLKRDFKGIWIPKEIWLDKNLKIIEKVFIVEIDSLDNKEGCFASNSYFAKFFGITPQRCSQIINSLLKKGLIEATYYREGKQIVKRVLNILTTYQGNVNKVLNKCEEPIKKMRRRYKGNVKDNNTSSNTTNNTYNNTLESDFNILWDSYPKKDGKKTAYKHYIADMKRGKNHDDILTAINNYKKKIEVEKTDPKYIKNGSTFFFNWEDFLTIELPKSKSREYTNDERKEHMKQFESKGGEVV